MFVLRARLLIATLWVGSLWTVGYLVAPTLFVTLSDRVLAGTIAGSLFRAEAWLSLACALSLMALSRLDSCAGNAAPRQVMLRLVASMLACTLISHFGIQPFMAAVRESASATGGMASDAKTQFGVLHGISSGLYLIQSLLGAVLILKLR